MNYNTKALALMKLCSAIAAGCLAGFVIARSIAWIYHL